MLILSVSLKRTYQIGEVLHLKLRDVEQQSLGQSVLVVDDVTPLPGYEPPGYACWSCGLVESAKENGGLPEGWILREYGDGVNYPKGHHFFCDAGFCQKSKMCRLCGCNDEHACDPPCTWVEPDRCSGCSG